MAPKRVIVDSYWLFAMGHICNIFELMQKSYPINNREHIYILSDRYSEIITIHNFPHCNNNIFGTYILNPLMPISFKGAHRTSYSGKTTKAIQQRNFYEGKNLYSQNNSKDMIDTLFPRAFVFNNHDDYNKLIESKYILVHPRTSFFRGGIKGARDTDKNLFNLLLDSLKKKYNILYLGIDKDIVDDKDGIYFSDDLHLNGHKELFTAISRAFFNLGSLSGPSHIAACCNIPTIYFDCPWPVTDFMNGFTYYSRNLDTYNENIYSSVERWYSSPLDKIDSDSTYLNRDSCQSTFSTLIHVIMFFIENASSIYLTDHLKRRQLLTERSVSYREICKIYEDNVQKTSVELCHPSDLLDWFVEKPELLDEIRVNL